MFRLAAPLVLAELGWMAMGIVDTMFVGRVSADAIGAVSLGTMIFYTIAIFASGLLLGLDTLVSQAFGAGDRDDCHHSLVNGIWLALFLIPGDGAVWVVVPLLARFGIDAGVLRDTAPLHSRAELEHRSRCCCSSACGVICNRSTSCVRF